MTLFEKNKQIERKFAQCINQRGMRNQLELDPIPNTAKHRNHFTRKTDGTCVFTAFMWQLNKLADEELDGEIDRRVDEAVKYFGL